MNTVVTGTIASAASNIGTAVGDVISGLLPSKLLTHEVVREFRCWLTINVDSMVGLTISSEVGRSIFKLVDTKEIEGLSI